MKTLLVIKESDFGWLRLVLPKECPPLVPICNKALLEYLVDFAIHCGIQEIRVATDMTLSELEAIFDDGGRWGIEMTYSIIRKTDGMEKIIQKTSRYCHESRILVMQGCFFLHYDKRKDYTKFMTNVMPGELIRCETGSIFIRDDMPVDKSILITSKPPMRIEAVKSINDIQRLSLMVLTKQPGSYVLPGYNNEMKIYTGRYVMIDKTARINPPVMIGNNVQILEGAVVGPEAVIGSDVIVDAHSRVQQSVIMNNTYVGERLVLNNKMASGHCLVDPDEKTVVCLEDPQLLREVNPGKCDRNIFQTMFHSVLAFILATFLAAPYAVLSFILKFQNRWHRNNETFLLDRRGQTISLPFISIDNSGWSGKIAVALALDRIPMLIQVIRGKLALVGTRLLPATEENKIKNENYAIYRPGVFSYAEGEYWPAIDADKEIVERFYLENSSMIQDLIMVVKTFNNKIRRKELK